MTTFQAKTLDEICDRTKRFPVVDGPFGTQLRADEYRPSGVPLVRVTNLSFDGRFKAEELVFISKGKALEIRRSELAKDDLIVAKTGATIGKCALFPLDEGVIASSCLKISVDSSKADPRFLLHRVVSPEGQKAILDGASGSTRTTINITPFKKISFKFPERDEQSRIAAVLDTVDEAIAKTGAVIAKLRQVRAGLLHDILTRGLDEHGQLRDPIAHPEQFQDSPIGLIPKEWDVKALESCVSSEITYGIVQAGPHIEGGVPYIRTGDMNGDCLVADQMLKTSPEIAARFRRSRVQTGEIVCAIRATVGKVLPVPPELDGANLTQGTARIAPKPDVNPAFLLWAIRGDRTQREITREVKGTTFFEITLADLRRIKAAIPQDPEEQKHIAAVIRNMEAQVSNEADGMAKLQRLKSGLMTDLLTGRVRVPETLELAR